MRSTIKTEMLRQIMRENQPTWGESRTKPIITRKDRKCAYCSHIIKQGELCDQTIQPIDSDFEVYHTHIQPCGFFGWYSDKLATN